MKHYAFKKYFDGNKLLNIFTEIIDYHIPLSKAEILDSLQKKPL